MADAAAPALKDKVDAIVAPPTDQYPRQEVLETVMAILQGDFATDLSKIRACSQYLPFNDPARAQMDNLVKVAEANMGLLAGQLATEAAKVAAPPSSKDD